MDPNTTISGRADDGPTLNLAWKLCDFSVESDQYC